MNMKGPRKAKAFASYWVALGALYPALTALLIFFGLTFIVYRGQSQDRYRNIINGHLLKTSLQINMHSLPTPKYPQLNQFLIVDESATHRALYPGVTSRISAYTDAMERIYQQTYKSSAQSRAATNHSPIDPELFVILNWDLPHAALNQFNQQLLTVVPQEFIKNIHLIVSQTEQIAEHFDFQVLSNDPCEDRHLAQAFCSFNLAWNDWAVQRTFDLAQPANVDPQHPATLPSHALTTAMPNALPSFVIIPPGLDQFRRTTFQHLLEAPISPSLKGVFIGQSHEFADEIKGAAPAAALAYEQNYINVFSPDAQGPSIKTVPYHHFLAMVFGQHLSGHYVTVPPTPWLGVMVAVSCLLAVIAVFFSHKIFFMILLLGTALLLPILNALSIRYLSLYLPSFEFYYFLLFSFLFASFLKLSWISYSRLRLRSKERALAHATDIKANFISLLSHNLNTPVAKMNGLLQILVQQPITPALKGELLLALRYVTELEVTIKSVLIINALEERSLNDASLRLDQFTQEMTNLQGVMKRLGIKMQIEVITSENDLLPFKLDKRVVGHAITASATLFNRKGLRNATDLQSEVVCQLEIVESEPSSPASAGLTLDAPSVEGDTQLAITIISQQGWLPPYAVECLASQRGPSLQDISSEQFMDGIFANLITSVVKHYQGSLQLIPQGQGGKILLKLPIA